MYTLYIDESGNDGPPDDDPHNQWFTAGGIIVNDADVRRFDTAYEHIIAEHFTNNDIALPAGFKLHYHDLRQNLKPYRSLPENDGFDVTNDIFDSIKNIDCYLVSSSADKRMCVGLSNPFGARTNTLFKCQERFQRFLEEHNALGSVVYERFSYQRRGKILRDLQRLRNSSSVTVADRIRSWIMDGDPFTNRVLQFSDFFVYAPYAMRVSDCKRTRRFEEIKYKYYNLDEYDELAW